MITKVIQVIYSAETTLEVYSIGASPLCRHLSGVNPDSHPFSHAAIGFKVASRRVHQDAKSSVRRLQMDEALRLMYH